MIDKIKYDSEYISYIENGESAAVFIIRDVVKAIDTTNKWIDVIDLKGFKNPNLKWNFSEITVELFPRKSKPFYPKNASDYEKKYITWQTAQKDISEQRNNGYRGQKFLVYPKLVNKNKGKTITVEKVWNKKFHKYIPEHWARSSDCEVRKVKVPIKPKWEYYIVSIKRLK